MNSYTPRTSLAVGASFVLRGGLVDSFRMGLVTRKTKHECKLGSFSSPPVLWREELETEFIKDEPL
jgi:hypothetical protein